MLLRHNAMTIGGDYDLRPIGVEDLTAPILPLERGHRPGHRNVSRSVRLDTQEILGLAVKSHERMR